MLTIRASGIGAAEGSNVRTTRSSLWSDLKWALAALPVIVILLAFLTGAI